MKKMRKIRLFVLSLFAFLFVGCDADINPSSLIGMSKKEVLHLAFEKGTLDNNGELNIGTWKVEKNGKRSYQNYYYKSLDVALKDPRLMDCDIWEIGKKYKFSLGNEKARFGVISAALFKKVKKSP